MDPIVHRELLSHAEEQRTVQNSWCMYLNNSFALAKLRSASYIRQEENNGEGGLDCIFQNKVGVEQNQKTFAFTHNVP